MPGAHSAPAGAAAGAGDVQRATGGYSAAGAAVAKRCAAAGVEALSASASDEDLAKMEALVSDLDDEFHIVSERCLREAVAFEESIVPRLKATLVAYFKVELFYCQQQKGILTNLVKELGGRERLVSYLPLSHIAAQAIDIYAGLVCTGRDGVQSSTLYFARPDALKGSLKDTLNAVRPTVFFGVPRVWE